MDDDDDDDDYEGSTELGRCQCTDSYFAIMGSSVPLRIRYPGLNRGNSFGKNDGSKLGHIENKQSAAPVSHNIRLILSYYRIGHSIFVVEKRVESSVLIVFDSSVQLVI
ncbi:hypothetical protein ANO14919_140850 [Xylariales sp. No.14919]|nr:hypothetical protein ANO14919_140850 [Xylariales sp. No.14919]